MIFQVPTEYYEALKREGKIVSPDWCRIKIVYGLDISEQGEFKSVTPLKQKRQEDKKAVTTPQNLTVPQIVSRSSGASANFLCDHSGYMLGIDNKERPERSREYFECAKKKHKGILEHISSPAARTVYRFFDHWASDQVAENPCLIPELEEIIFGSSLVLMMDEEYIHGDPDIRQCWKEYSCRLGTGHVGVCLVIGHREGIARVHSTIKGAREAQSSDAMLVSFNAPTFESYSKEQSPNALVGVYTAYVYTTALNYLLEDQTHGTAIGDTTVVYWPEEDDERYQNISACISELTMESQEIVDGIFRNLAEGEAVTAQDVQDSPDMGKKFYILGLVPNAVRLVVRLPYQDSFGNVLKHIKEHYDRMEIVRPAVDAMGHLGAWRMLQKTINKKSRDKEPVPSIPGAVHRAIVSGSRYPVSLYQAMLGKIRVEQDDGDNRTYRITRGRVAIIKAYLLKNESKREEITMALNENSNNTAYILGRKFVVLEATQEDANPGINATIKDKYSNSACVMPAAILPILLRLKNGHVKKVNNGVKEMYYEKMLGDSQGRLITAEGQKTVCPRQFTLEEQGMFILGYCHQAQERYEKKIEEEAQDDRGD